MDEEIKSALVELDIEARQRRKRTARNIVIVVALAILFFIIPYLYPQYSILFGIDILLIGFGGLYILLSAIPKLIQPLEPEYRAFRKFAEAIDVLQKSQKEVAYEEAHRDVENAYEILKSIGLSEDIAWYKATNEIFGKFLKDLELIVLPATEKSIIKLDHLREIALAIYSLDPVRLTEVNKTLETESNYKESTIKSGESERIGDKIRRFLRTHGSTKDALAVCSFIMGSAAFYYFIINFSTIQKEYVFGASVAAFIGLVGIYFRRGKNIPLP